MTRAELIKKGTHICKVDIPNNLYRDTAGGENDIYLLDGVYYSVKTYNNQLEYLGKNHTEEIGTASDIKSNPMIVPIDAYRAIFGDNEADKLLDIII